MSLSFDIRHLAGLHEVDFFNRLPYALNDEIADDLEQGRRRLEWTWLAVRDERMLGRLALWSPVGAAESTQLDVFDLDDALSDDEQRQVGTALLETARRAVIGGQATPPEVARYLSADWCDGILAEGTRILARQARRTSGLRPTWATSPWLTRSRARTTRPSSG